MGEANRVHDYSWSLFIATIGIGLLVKGFWSGWLVLLGALVAAPVMVGVFNNWLQGRREPQNEAYIYKWRGIILFVFGLGMAWYEGYKNDSQAELGYFDNYEWSSGSRGYLAKTLGEVRAAGFIDDRRGVAREWVAFRGYTDNLVEPFGRCVSDHIYNKEKTITVAKVLNWCDTTWQATGSLDGYFDFGEILKQFSGWDGAHKGFEKYVKDNLHDRGTYEHINTGWRLDRDVGHLVVAMKFRAADVAGVLGVHQLQAVVAAKSGQLLAVDVLD